MWAILSGIQGNLPAYQAVLEDIQQRSVTVENLYILCLAREGFPIKSRIS